MFSRSCPRVQPASSLTCGGGGCTYQTLKVNRSYCYWGEQRTSLYMRRSWHRCKYNCVVLVKKGGKDCQTRRCDHEGEASGKGWDVMTCGASDWQGWLMCLSRGGEVKEGQPWRHDLFLSYSCQSPSTCIIQSWSRIRLTDSVVERKNSLQRFYADTLRWPDIFSLSPGSEVIIHVF